MLPNFRTVVSYCSLVPSLQAWERSSVEPADKPLSARVYPTKESLKEATFCEGGAGVVDFP